MESTDQSPVKSGGISTPRGDQFGLQIMKQLPNGMSIGTDAASYLSNASIAASENAAESPGNPRPSHRVVPADEPGTHQVTFTVTVSVAFSSGETALCMCSKNVFLSMHVFHRRPLFYSVFLPWHNTLCIMPRQKYAETFLEIASVIIVVKTHNEWSDKQNISDLNNTKFLRPRPRLLLTRPRPK